MKSASPLLNAIVDWRIMTALLACWHVHRLCFFVYSFLYFLISLCSWQPTRISSGYAILRALSIFLSLSMFACFRGEPFTLTHRVNWCGWYLRRLIVSESFEGRLFHQASCACYDKLFCCSSFALPTCRGAHYSLHHTLYPCQKTPGGANHVIGQLFIYRFLLSVKLIFEQESDQSLRECFICWDP